MYKTTLALFVCSTYVLPCNAMEPEQSLESKVDALQLAAPARRAKPTQNIVHLLRQCEMGTLPNRYVHAVIDRIIVKKTGDEIHAIVIGNRQHTLGSMHPLAIGGMRF